MNIPEDRAALEAKGVEALAIEILNMKLNHLVGAYANYDEDDEDANEHGKRVPYIGWFWRSVDFASPEPYIPIGNCGEFVGFMESNKWDYPQRDLTPEEAEQVIAIVVEAYNIDRGGGILSDIVKNAGDKLAELWPLLQTFEISKSGFWIFGPQGRVAHADTREDADSLIVTLQEAAPGFIYRKEPV